MIDWEVGDDHLRVVDADSAEMIVRGTEFAVDGRGPSISRPADDTVECTVRELRFPRASAAPVALGSEGRYVARAGDSLSLPPDEYVVDVDAAIETYVGFSGRATIERRGDVGAVVVRFPERKRAVLGFRGRHDAPADVVAVPETPEGVAAGLSALSSSIATDAPDKSYPSLRGHPPLLELGDALDVPEGLETDDAPVVLEVPPSLESLYVIAPLSYYLGATVRTGSAGPPTLRIPGAGIERTLSRMPSLERDAERLLRKTFFLDCLVRAAGRDGAELFEGSLLDALELDARRLYESDYAERLATYLAVPYGAVEHRLPDWHLSTYVEPTPENVETLPFLLDRLSLVYMPRTSELEGKELVERSLEDFYRGPRAGAGQIASVDIVKPELRGGRVHGWLADGVPIDVFKSAPEAYRNRLDFLEGGDETTIRVVLNDPTMGEEHDDVASIYRTRSGELPIDVTVEESLDTASLARVFESDHDFVHYIGHCEVDGLRCPDGHLSTASLDRCNTQTFFLNACGSFYEGRGLVEKGSVAGAVTFTQVLNDHAVKVGSTFARLLVHGFSIERAMRLARRRIMMGKDYAVVGDGTHALTGSHGRLPTTATIEPTEGDEFLLSLECFSPREVGSDYAPEVPGNEHAYLCGTTSSFALEREELVSFLQEAKAPVIYDCDAYWSQELWPELES